MAFLDLNGDSTFARLEPHVNFDTAPILVVGSQPVQGSDVVLSAASVEARVTTHTWATNRAINYAIFPNRAMPVRAVVCAGAQLVAPYDLGVDEFEETRFTGYVALPQSATLTTGSQYPTLVEFADGTTEWLAPRISNVIDTMPTAVAPIGDINEVVPTFAWSLSGVLPTTYQQALWVGDDANRFWEYENIPSNIRSVVYNLDGRAQPTSLPRAIPYHWNLRVRDEQGNTSSLESVEFRVKP